MSRETFLARVKQAALAGQAYRVHVPEVADTSARGELAGGGSDYGGAGYVGAGGDLCGRLAEEIAAVGGVPHLVDDLPAARRALESLLERLAPRAALTWEHPLLDAVGLDELLQRGGIARRSYATLAALPPEEQRAQMLAAEVAISSCTYAVAETGTLAMASEPGRERCGSLLPPVHIAVVSAEQVLPDLFDLFGKFAAEGLDRLPSNLALITGPSKTGDLELRLITGVHGPGEWHVIIARA